MRSSSSNVPEQSNPSLVEITSDQLSSHKRSTSQDKSKSDQNPFITELKDPEFLAWFKSGLHEKDNMKKKLFLEEAQSWFLNKNGEPYPEKLDQTAIEGISTCLLTWLSIHESFYKIYLLFLQENGEPYPRLDEETRQGIKAALDAAEKHKGNCTDCHKYLSELLKNATPEDISTAVLPSTQKHPSATDHSQLKIRRSFAGGTITGPAKGPFNWTPREGYVHLKTFQDINREIMERVNNKLNNQLNSPPPKKPQGFFHRFTHEHPYLWLLIRLVLIPALLATVLVFPGALPFLVTAVGLPGAFFIAFAALSLVINAIIEIVRAFSSSASPPKPPLPNADKPKNLDKEEEEENTEKLSFLKKQQNTAIKNKGKKTRVSLLAQQFEFETHDLANPSSPTNSDNSVETMRELDISPSPSPSPRADIPFGDDGYLNPSASKTPVWHKRGSSGSRSPIPSSFVATTEGESSLASMALSPSEDQHLSPPPPAAEKRRGSSLTFDNFAISNVLGTALEEKSGMGRRSSTSKVNEAIAAGASSGPQIGSSHVTKMAEILKTKLPFGSGGQSLNSIISSTATNTSSMGISQEQEPGAQPGSPPPPSMPAPPVSAKTTKAIGISSVGLGANAASTFAPTQGLQLKADPSSNPTEVGKKSPPPTPFKTNNSP